ncbi:hypothetical protein [Tuwongella immobilis]|uniref:Uncharacterized protein n=1 Tax=Tuwongella immobilis TaxID=692036 RepID=A0A6C2YNL9_9BACT|nr:hypothetical protein [Tuwongella immobilis]VIP03218.1 Uncharacterized protein OS=Planctomyces maris DSM 8797 GN=PM8797T_24106 PE=4 SV=1 [Tuwongella immobilis]VTS03742.1 Uncharacterized protein OS=Planctomyces maris DSM 8797 GN=PM8797T_24106 PE=4 SV=1 [Tuwongella immobilis]
MAKKQSGETKIGMLLTLIFFILATIISGTLAYFGYSEQETLIAKEKKANEEKLAKNSLLEKERVRKILLRIAMGIENKSDQDDFAGMVSQHPDAVQEEYQNILAGLKTLSDSKDFEWRLIGNEPAPRPTKSMVDLVSSFKEEAEKQKKSATDTTAEKSALVAKLDTATSEMAKAKQGYETQVKSLSDQINKAKGDVTEAAMTAFKQVNDLGTERDQIKLEMNKSNRNSAEEQRKLQEQIADMKKKIDTLEAKRERTYVDQNKPKGVIERREEGNVYINLGTADYLRAGTRFSIFASDNNGELASTYRGQVVIDLFSRDVKVAPLDPATERLLTKSGRLDVPDELRGAIEVISLIGPHQALARIIYERDPIRNPIRPSDKLYNPIWTAGGGRERIVVAGLIDLDGDANDDTAQFIRELTRVGVQVQGYLDPKTRKLIGSPIAYETDYLVLGEPLVVPSSNPNDPRREAVVEYTSEMQRLEADAKAKGVEVIRAKRFMALVGYQIPQRPPGLRLNTGSYLGGSVVEKGAPPPPGDGN